jgi:hypothetical protein
MILQRVLAQVHVHVSPTSAQIRGNWLHLSWLETIVAIQNKQYS